VLVATILGPAPGLAAEAGNAHNRRAPTSPNIVLILTDDQRWDSLLYMPHVRQDLMSNGMKFQNAFVSNSLCCPSRSTILTGNYSHTTGVYTNIAPYGGWPAFHAGAESSTIAMWLHDAGYHTALIGKYMNEYGPDNPFIPPGWDRWAAFEDEVSYYDYTMNVDGSFVSYGHTAADYSTDVLAGYAVDEIEQTPSDQPLFMVVAPSAPHGPAIPAPRDIGTVLGGPTRWPPNVNEGDMSDKPRYMRKLPLIDKAKLSDRWVRTMETLRAVDDAVHDVVGALRSSGRLDNTLIIYIAGDNGGTAIGGLNGTFNEWSNLNSAPEDIPYLLSRLDEYGGPNSYPNYAVGWAMAGSTPATWCINACQGGSHRMDTNRRCWSLHAIGTTA
jgi:arylsulfatase A-like enzyme